MTAHDLLDELRNQGIFIRLDGDDLDVEGPLELIDDPTKIERIRENKLDIVAVVRERDSSTEPVEVAEPQAVAGWRGGIGPGADCRTCGQRRWWRSVHNVVVCGTCHPPGVAGLVREWIGGQ